MEPRFWKNPVFIISAAVILLLVLLGALLPAVFGDTASKLYDYTTIYFGWLYLFAVFIIILFLVVIAITKLGTLRLGADTDQPEYPFFTWIGMLFSAGFGVGLVFWGVAEPMSHFFLPPFVNIEGETVEAARVAMGYAFFHWGVSQWSVFALVGLIIAFLQFKKHQDGLISTALEPVIHHNTISRNLIDSLAVIATVMGVATSLGLGVLQMNGGLKIVFGLDNSIVMQLLIILLLFAAYMLSSTTGLKKGIPFLSNLNLGLAMALLLFAFIAGPGVFILESFTLAIGDYLTNFIQYSLRLQPYRGGTWVRDWTIFYWAWSIAWSPFVGAFVARVSKGRTIREYILGVMVIPPAIAWLWIAAFGGTALWLDLQKNAGIAAAVNADLTSALFLTFDYLPLTLLISLLSILLIFTFLVTSADSATYILGSMTSYGSLDPPQAAKALWGFLIAAISVVLLYAGGLEALQTASLVAALPFTLILLLLIFAIFKLLQKEPLPIRQADLKRFRHLEKAARKKHD